MNEEGRTPSGDTPPSVAPTDATPESEGSVAEAGTGGTSPPGEPAGTQPPGQPAAPPAGGRPTTAPPQAKSNKKWWFIGCGCALVLCFFVTIAAALIGYVVYTSSGPEGNSAAAKAVMDQAKAIKNHDFETAYTYMSDGYRDEIDVHAFEKTVEANTGQLLAYKSFKITRDEIGGDSAIVVVDVVGQDGQKANISYILTPGYSGDWKIEGFQRKRE